jgi:cell division transport system ATP-binding protein
MIVLERVTKEYMPGERALDGVSLRVEPGEFVIVTGPSGAGKTTLLRMLYREVVPSEGRVFVDDVDLRGMKWWQVPHLRRRIGIVFQDFRLLERKTVAENVSFVLRALAWPARERRERTQRVLEWVGLAHKARAWPNALSGGEQQRVAIARALAAEPRFLLADEPTGNLDPERSREILELFRQAHARGTTVLLATHDRRLIDEAKVRVVSLVQGGIEEDRKPA